MAVVSIPSPLIAKLAPNARSVYLAAFAKADTDLDQVIGGNGKPLVFGINATKLRLAHFLAQTLHETDGWSIRVESMNYSAKRLPVVWPARFKDPAVAANYAHNPERLAEKTYGGRMGNGPEGSGDGWRYIGRGLLQITGRDAYTRIGATLGIDLAGDPELALSPQWALAIAAAEWAASGWGGRDCNGLADADDVVGVTRAVNGGTIGLASRRAWLARTKAALGVTSAG